jgi:hypothetical protein
MDIKFNIASFRSRYVSLEWCVECTTSWKARRIFYPSPYIQSRAIKDSTIVIAGDYDATYWSIVSYLRVADVFIQGMGSYELLRLARELRDLSSERETLHRPALPHCFDTFVHST